MSELIFIRFLKFLKYCIDPESKGCLEEAKTTKRCYLTSFQHSALTKFSCNSSNNLSTQRTNLSKNSFLENTRQFGQIPAFPYNLRILSPPLIISIQIFSIRSGHVHYPTIPIQPLWWTHVWNPNSKKLSWH